MKRLVVLLGIVALVSCNNEEKKEEPTANSYTYQNMSSAFPNGTVPYEITDDQLLNSKDTDTLPSSFVQPLISDSLKNLVKGGQKLVYVPLSKFEKAGAETYFVVKAVGGLKKAAFVLVFDKEGQFSSALPFLVVDNDPETTQTSSIDKSFSIARSRIRKKGVEILGEGKDVFVYDAASKSFSWVVTDPLDEGELINPIDTLGRTHKLTGDYVKDKKNIVSIRDGRHPNQLILFVHMDNGDCKGELKGDLIITSSTTAVYRQAGDPCILQVSFSGNIVSLKEQQGCGNYRGIDCAFSGTFTKKKTGSSSKQKKAKT